ncbi:hypothetical protein PA25_13850 [Pseudoalteromonas sp. A25]|uniref:GreA/GreB family elongation factor n=1 Tax=Pseudoalteromonas sp. A25 TaxID=116092 RepID=UPI0012611CED|nr:GreA/GreB family elongation factor [Pseudoalteromonas sp. A25]BBN81400.1 hypothetical protein PA25_13850 [Pseudoalteromonas sp. A25]
MNKSHVIEHIKFALEAKLSDAKQAAKSAHTDATHEQSAAETQYDSLSIESGYLAHGQSERVNEAHKSIKLFSQSYDIQASPKVVLGSLIQAIDIEDRVHWFYFGPSEGGLKIYLKQALVLVITPSSPIGKAMHNKCKGDECEYVASGQSHCYQIIAIL